jgi:SPP1 family predicted phage head-tail adaptor
MAASDEDQDMIGALRHRTQILIRSETPDGGYGTSEIFTELVTVWAQFIPLSGLKRYEAQSYGADITHKVLMRYRGDVTDRHWLLWNQRRFQIKTFRYLNEKTAWLELMVQEAETVLY